MRNAISIVIITYNELENLLMTIQSIEENPTREKYEIIVIDSSDKPSEDFPTYLINKRIRHIRSPREGISKARNLGAKMARGDIIIFLDSHCRVSPFWLDNIRQFMEISERTVCAPCITPLGNRSVKAYGMALKNWLVDVDWLYNDNKFQPLDVPSLCGCCMAFRKKEFFDLGMFDELLLTYGFEDTEICMRAWLMNYKVIVLPHVEVEHLFREKFPYDVSSDHMNYNRSVVAFEHFGASRLNNVISELIKSGAHIEHIRKIMTDEKIVKRRNILFARRTHDDDWFFKKFNIEL